jgi:hypothetical protein
MYLKKEFDTLAAARRSEVGHCNLTILGKQCMYCDNIDIFNTTQCDLNAKIAGVATISAST